MLKNYFKLSLFFYLFLLVSLYFGYDAIEIDSTGKMLLCVSSFFAFSLIHFALTLVLSTCLSFIKKSLQPFFLATIIISLFLASIIIYAIVAGYYVGISNWGSAIDYKLFSDILFRPFSFISLVLVHQNANLILGGSIIMMLIMLAYYYLRRKDIESISDYLSTRKYIGFGSLLLSIILLYSSTSIDKQKLSSSVFQKDIFMSFVNPLDPSNSMKRIDGMGNVSFNFEKVVNFDKKNVIILSVECLRSDHLSFNGYNRTTTPFLDATYKAGNLVDMEVSTSTCATTFCGILTTLNSCNFANLGYLKFGIHDYLKKQGYHINFLLSGLHDSFTNLKTHYGKNIDTYIESKFYPRYDINDDEFIFAALNDVKNYNGTPNFFFIHLMSPHIAGYKHDRFKVFKPTFDYNSLFKRQKRTINVNDDAVTLYTNNYDNSILQADNIIKRFLAKLKAKGFMDNAVVAIVGDHGESLGEHTGLLGHKSGLWQEYIGVPVIFIDTDTSFYKERAYASQIDIAPTIADRLQLPIPEHWEGKSLNKKTKNRITYHETKNVKGYRMLASVEKRGKQINKFIYVPQTGERYFYNLVKDPSEKNNLIAKCKNPQRYIDDLLNYSEANSTPQKKIAKSIKKKKKKKKPVFAKFLTKGFIKNNLDLEGNVFKNYDEKSSPKKITSYFTWNQNNKESNTIVVEIKTHPENSKSAQKLLRSGVQVKHNLTKRVQHVEVNKQSYFFSSDNQDIVKFYKNKSIRISATQKSQSINRASLIKLVEAIQVKL